MLTTKDSPLQARSNGPVSPEPLTSCGWAQNPSPVNFTGLWASA